MEYGRNDKDRDVFPVEFCQEVEPVFILDEEDQLWIQEADPLSCVPRCVERHIKDPFGAGIALSHLIPAGRVKGKHYPVFGV